MRIEDNGAEGCGGVTFFQYFEIINGLGMQMQIYDHKRISMKRLKSL